MRQAENRARLATSMYLQGEFAPALREARRAIQISPECVDCRLVLATIYAARNEMDQAEQELRTILEQSENNPYALNALANVYLNQGRPSEAEPLARRASEDEDYDGRHLAFYNLGRAHLDQGQSTEALEAFGQALRENPRMCVARYAIAGVYVRQGRFDDAISQLETALAEGQEDEEEEVAGQQRMATCADMPDTHQLLGVALLGVGRDEEAIQSFSRCAELAPEGTALHSSCAERLESQEPDGEPGSISEE